MTAQPLDSKPADGAPRHKPTRAQRVVGFTFLGAFGLTMLTVVLTGLNVRSPSSLRNVDTPSVTLAIGEPQTIHLMFVARMPGDNALPLTLVARSGSGGQLAAQLRAGDERKTFVIEVTVAP